VRALALLVATAACGGNQSQAAPDRGPGTLEKVTEALCVTKGSAALGAEVNVPTMRAVALHTQGDAAALTFTYRGHSFDTRKLASGQERHQLGLKLRARDGCNLVYVMWRLDTEPRPRAWIDVSVKLNPDAKTHAECGAGGYTKLEPTRDVELMPVPVLTTGDTHTLRAAIAGNDLRAWVDDRLVWRGTLPSEVRALEGPAGIRSDNLDFDLVAFAAPRGTVTSRPACLRGDGD